MVREQLAICHDVNEDGGRYWAEVEGGQAELTYRKRDKGVIVIDHTFTPPEARGRKIAERLVERAVADARANSVKIVPKCPYVAALFKRRPDLADLKAA